MNRSAENVILRNFHYLRPIKLNFANFELLPHPVRKSELSTKIHYTDHVVRIWGILTPSPPYEDTFTK